MTNRKKAKTYHATTRDEVAAIQKTLEAASIPFETRHNPNDFQPYEVAAYLPGRGA